MISKSDEKKLIKSAIETQKFAYVPVSKVGVGASLLTKEGHIYNGCNVQSVISGLGICAEQCAIHNAVAHGAYNFKAICVAFPSLHSTRPCGSCLQLIHEFKEVSNYDIQIICLNKNGKVVERTSISKLLPKSYGPVESHKNISKYKKNLD